MRAWRCLPCLALIACLAFASFAVYAQSREGPLASLSSDAILAFVGALLMALLAGYARGLQQRITLVEQQQRQVESQISLFRETVLERHPTKPDLANLREEIRERFDEVRDMIRGLR